MTKYEDMRVCEAILTLYVTYHKKVYNNIKVAEERLALEFSVV